MTGMMADLVVITCIVFIGVKCRHKMQTKHGKPRKTPTLANYVSRKPGVGLKLFYGQD